MAKSSKKVEQEPIEEKLEVAEQPEEKTEKVEKTFKVKLYLEGHKQPYVKEFASQGELERAKADFKKNKSVIRFE